MKSESLLAHTVRKTSLFLPLLHLKSWGGQMLVLLALWQTGSVSSAADWKLPAANQGQWKPGIDVGVNGGIDQYRPGGAKARTKLVNVSLPPYNADKTGATPCQSAISAALAASVAGNVLYFPAGTYKITSQIQLNRYDSGKTLRGDGASTIFYGSNDNGVMFTMQDMGGFGSRIQTVAGTKTKGTSSLTVADSTGYSVGDLAQILVENEENNTRIQSGISPTWTSAGFPNSRQVLVKVTAVAAGSITVDPPLCWDCTPYVTTIGKNDLNWANRKIGFEDMAVTFDPAAHPRHFIATADADECWIHNVTAPAWKKNTSAGSVLFISGAYKTEVRKCDFRTLAPASYSDDGGIQTSNSSSCLLVDNICAGFDSGIYNSGKTYGNVIAYNYLECDSNYPGHNGHNSLDLWEGNVSSNIHFDGYHGSNSNMTVYRNWLYRGLYVKRFMYYIGNAGNVMGYPGVMDHGCSFGNPNIGNSSYSGTANPFIGDFHADWKITGTLTTRTSDTEGVVTAVGGGFDADSGAAGNGAYSRLISLRWAGGSRYQMAMPARNGQVLTVSGGSGIPLPAQGTTFTLISTFAAGYQELDLGVEQTMIRAQNWLALKVGGGRMEATTTDTLPGSLAYGAKPGWFGDLAWPPINPDAPQFSLDIIPAGYRFKNGTNPPGITTSTPTTRPNTVSGLRKSS